MFTRSVTLTPSSEVFDSLLSLDISQKIVFGFTTNYPKQPAHPRHILTIEDIIDSPKSRRIVLDRSYVSLLLRLTLLKSTGKIIITLLTSQQDILFKYADKEVSLAIFVAPLTYFAKDKTELLLRNPARQLLAINKLNLATLKSCSKLALNLCYSRGLDQLTRQLLVDISLITFDNFKVTFYLCDISQNDLDTLILSVQDPPLLTPGKSSPLRHIQYVVDSYRLH